MHRLTILISTIYQGISIAITISDGDTNPRPDLKLSNLNLFKRQQTFVVVYVRLFYKLNLLIETLMNFHRRFSNDIIHYCSFAFQFQLNKSVKVKFGK